MNVRRLAAVFVIALLVSGLCTWTLSRKMGAHAAARGPDHQYVAPSKPILPGEVLKPENLELVSWPDGAAVVGAFAKLEDVVGRSVMYPIDKDQPITDKFLNTAGSGMGLAGKIPLGMRAIALRSDEVMGVAGFIFPGSHLDVVVTYRSDRSPEPITFTVLQDAEVLAVGQKFQPDPEGKPVAATVVTLLLNPQDAESAVMASTQGTFHFVLRGSSDKVRVPDVPITLSKISGASAMTVQNSSAGERGRTVSREHGSKQGFAVQTIAGDKQTTDTFSAGNSTP
jgi:pilus assembly protein CpaB